MKPLADIWSNTLNFEGFFKESKTKQIENIELTQLEQADLYQILSLDKVASITPSHYNSKPIG